MPLSSPLSYQGSSPEVKQFSRIPQVLEIPNLIQMQIQSFNWLKNEGIAELFREMFPIRDLTGNRLELEFVDDADDYPPSQATNEAGEEDGEVSQRTPSIYFREPKYTPEECRQKEITYNQSLYARIRLRNLENDERLEQDIFMGDIPMMTENGTFIINGAERVVVSQLVRSPGAYFTLNRDVPSDRMLCSAKVIPYRGAWLEFETSNKDLLTVKVDRKRKLNVTTFLRALGFATDKELHALFRDENTKSEHNFIAATLDKNDIPDDGAVQLRKDESVLRQIWKWCMDLRGLRRNFSPYDATLIAQAQLEFYRRLRPGEPPNLENALKLIRETLFDANRYNLGRVGRFKLNSRLNMQAAEDARLLSIDDITEIVKEIIRLNNGVGQPDDIDHLGNRRVRGVGELVQNQMRLGLIRLERMVKERMTQTDPESAAPQALINIRPVVGAVREFFGGSQLSQFMDQTNPLAELTHKRRLSALGPGGLSRERAGFDVRDVHFSHYGRICPIETPEGPNIGLLSSLASYARINAFGFIESPYRRVLNKLPNTDPELKGRTLTDSVTNESGEQVAQKNRVIGDVTFKKLQALPPCDIPVKPFVSTDDKDVVYLSADQEDRFIIAQANVDLDKKNQLVGDRVEVRIGKVRSGEASESEAYAEESPDRVDFMDVSPMQIMSVSASLIPFLEHDDANRALMGSNMQRQAVPLLRPQAPLIGTGIEDRVAQDSGQVIMSAVDGTVSSVTGEAVVVTDDSGNERRHGITKFRRTNQGTCFNQRAIVEKGQRVRKGQVLADSSSTEGGRLALGQNVLVAFMSWEGYNYEDAIILSENLVKDDFFTSIRIEKHEMEARDTKLGPEEITQDIPNVGEENLQDLDERGIIRIGAEVGPGDILVGKVTPKGETELTAEEKLLRAIFGEKSRDVKDTSLRVPHGERGKVIDVKTLSRANKDELPASVNEAVRVWVAQTRKISVGDKMAGRHGNKGVVARVLPAEDMPFLPDGTPVDIILNPIGVPSRMNLGQVLETHMGWAANFLNFRAVTPIFDGATDLSIEDGLARAWFLEQARSQNGNGQNGHATTDGEAAEKWLQQRGYSSNRLWDDAVVGEALEAALRIWLEEEAGVPTSELSLEELKEQARETHRTQKLAPPTFGKVTLRDGNTGQPFSQPVAVGYIYMMKLVHLVEDKIHARSTGPYSLITQQPLGGKAQFGGQRFGEMEVWALEAYSAAHNLQEVLTVKSDDVTGRVKTYEAIVKGEDVVQPGIPESFNVLVKELQSLGLAVELLNEEPPMPPLEEEIEVDLEIEEESMKELPID